MKDLRRRFERFCLKNRGKGIPNLMLVIAIGNLVVYVLSRVDPSNIVYSYLCFSRSAILCGQVWRLFTYVFTYLNDTAGIYLFLAVVSLFCYYQFGKILESYWGPFRFNLYYLTGLLLTDLAALLLGSGADAAALNLSLFLAVATIAPEARVLLLFFIPLKMKYMAWVYLGGTVLSVFLYLRIAPFLSFYWLLPIVPLLNYLLFLRQRRQKHPAGRPALPPAQKLPHHRHRRSAERELGRVLPLKTGEKPYRHKCTVCGRTDTDYPNLEFRYCSKCNGYYCYCIDHINNHVHITTPPEGNKNKKDVPSGTSFFVFIPRSPGCSGESSASCPAAVRAMLPRTG